MNDFERDVDEALAKAMPVEQAPPEAPLSIHIDAYYKGFHVGTTIRMMDNTLIPTARIMSVIDGFALKGFQPSWNTETNTAHQAPIVGQQGSPQAITQGLGNCSKCGAPNAISKAGKTYCSKRCWL